MVLYAQPESPALSAALPGEQLSISKIGWMPIIGYIFNYFCTFLAGPEMVSRFETAKDEKTARNAAWLSAILMAAMSVFPTLLGLAALLAVNLTSKYTGLHLGFNLFNGLTAGILGVPGVVLLLLVQWVIT